MSDRRIWKFPLAMRPGQIVQMPSDAKLLHVALQFGELQLWAIVEPTNGTVNRMIFCVATGAPMPTGPISYLGTTQHDDGAFIFHWFEPRHD